MICSLQKTLLFRLCWCLLILTESSSSAWKHCAAEDGGGHCPNRNTCCPTTQAGVSSCIPAKSQDPEYALGQCCDGNTGCGYGYQCASDPSGIPYCQLKESAPGYLHNDTSRYELCSVPIEMQTFYGYPMGGDADADRYRRVAYYSNMGDITTVSSAHLAVETAIIMVHGSARNADDYFCAALSLLDDQHHTMNSTLVIAPLFASPEDGNVVDNVLIWADHDDRYPLSHSWRYGADAMNAPISSYAVLDALVKHLSSATVQFPHLRRIAVAGHSAGGQLTHRWALLSSSSVWKNSKVELVSVVANPRSYCYLDGRRILRDGSFDLPDADDTVICKTYNQWQWGLDQGGYLPCPYKDRALEDTTAKEMAERYTTRNVVYLSGELDVLRANDRCETSIFQGRNRQERAKNYVSGLQQYFGRHVHDFHIIMGSPHDHSLMFQSPDGKGAIFGHGDRI